MPQKFALENNKKTPPQQSAVRSGKRIEKVLF